MGDEIVASDASVEDGVRWAKLGTGSEAARTNGFVRKVPVDLPVDGLIATEGLIEETKEEGVLSKAEIKEVLEKCSDPHFTLPLEAKYWTRQQLEMFVMSGGTIRPKGCSIPDERLMANINMGQDDVLRALAQATDWLSEADALLIGSGAGMGVDSGLGTFRGGHRGVWQGLEAVGLAYEEICDGKWFREDPHLAWAFWDHCYRAYQETAPHDGYAHVREWGQRCPLGYFSFTSNIDSHWIASGASAERVLEVHGALRWLQCSKPCCPDVWKAPKDHGLTMLPNHRVAGTLPTCPKCKAVARPNVQMFGGDAAFSKARRAVQFGRYDAWLKQLEARPDRDSLRITCLEVGCGLTVPTVRKELEGVLRKFPGARLIRVNPENPGIAQDLAGRGVSLPLRAGAAVDELRQRLSGGEPEATFILWGRDGGGGCEVRAPCGAALGRLLRLAQSEHGMTVEFTQATTASSHDLAGKSVAVSLDASVPVNCFRHIKAAEGATLEVSVVLTVDASFARDGQPSAVNDPLAMRIEVVRRMLDDMNTLYEEPEYQATVRACVDKRGVLQAARGVHYQVLPKYGLEANDRGTAAMTHVISAVQCVPDIQAKVDKSMDLSYVAHMGHLPAVEAPRPKAAADAAATSAPPAAAPLRVRLTPAAPSCSSSSSPVSPGIRVAEGAQVEATTYTTIGELRGILRRLWSWDEATAAAARFSSDGGLPLADSDRVREVIVVEGAPLHRPPEPVEVTFTEMNPEAEEVTPRSLRLQLMSDCTALALREALGEACGWSPEVRRRARFLIKLGGGFGTLKEHERIEARRSIFVHGAPLARLDGDATVGGSTSSPGVAKGPPAAAAAVAAHASGAGRGGGAKAAQELHEDGWIRCPCCDLDLPPVEQMDASDLSAVRRRVEQMGYSGFSVWAGYAFLKSAGRPLRRQDVEFKGPGAPVEFHLYIGLSASKARKLTLEAGLSLQRELMDKFGAPEFQQRLQELKATLSGPNARRFPGERMKLLLSVQGVVLPKYGFEASLAGVMHMMEAFATSAELQASEEVQKNGLCLDKLLA